MQLLAATLVLSATLMVRQAMVAAAACAGRTRK